MIDLQQFCGKDIFRPYLHQPFSEGGFTYATNGYILVRVPEVPGIGPMKDRPEKFFPENIFKGRETLCFVKPLIVSDLPARKEEDGECLSCDGRGTEHDCPDCYCTYEDCDGTGKQKHITSASTEWAGAILDTHYAAMILDLPGVKMATTTKPEQPVQFEFDGGIGAVMPMRAKHAHHVEAFAPPVAA